MLSLRLPCVLLGVIFLGAPIRRSSAAAGEILPCTALQFNARCCLNHLFKLKERHVSMRHSHSTLQLMPAWEKERGKKKLGSDGAFNWYPY
jgi:hypothetical protein